jgi:hypothetical protein
VEERREDPKGENEGRKEGRERVSPGGKRESTTNRL